MKYDYDYDVPIEIPVSRHARSYSGEVQGKVVIHYPCGHEGPKDQPKKHLLWLCECECGVMFTARAGVIADKRLSTCGRCEPVNAALMRHLIELPRKRSHEQLPLPLGIPDGCDIDGLVSELDAVESTPEPVACTTADPQKPDEVGVIGICTDALSQLDEAQCSRVIHYLGERFTEEY